MASNLILASGSPRREELLKRLGLNFTTVPSKINEKKFNKLNPVDMVCELAIAKAEEVAQLVEDTVVIGADTIVVYKEGVLGKPTDKEDAKNMLKKLQGKKHSVLTGIAVLETDTGKVLVDYDKTDVYMRSLEPAEINGYVNTGEPMDKAGAYGIQGLGGVFIERINGSYFTVMGLPLHKLVIMLKEFSINIFT